MIFTHIQFQKLRLNSKIQFFKQNMCHMNKCWHEIVYYITRGETERLHECEVCCPSETRAAITRNAFAVFCFEQCTLFFIATLLWIWLAVTVERVETATFNPLYRYRKSDFQRRRYEKLLPKWGLEILIKVLFDKIYILCGSGA